MKVEGLMVGETEVKRLEKSGRVVELQVVENEVVEIIMVGREVYVVKGVEDEEDLYEVLKVEV